MKLQRFIKAGLLLVFFWLSLVAAIPFVALFSPEAGAQLQRAVLPSQLQGLGWTFTTTQTFKARTNNTSNVISLEGGDGLTAISPRIGATAPATLFWTSTGFEPATAGQSWGSAIRPPDLHAQDLTVYNSATLPACASATLGGSCTTGLICRSTEAAYVCLDSAWHIVESETQQLLNGKDKHYVVLTFDDGNDEGYDLYRDVMNARNVKGTFYINTNNIGNAGQLTWAEVNTLIDEGHEIGDHLPGGESAETISSEELYDLLVESQADIDAQVTGGYPLRTYSYPQNQWGDTCDNTPTCSVGVPIPHIVQMFHDGARRSTDVPVTFLPLHDPYTVGGGFWSSAADYIDGARRCAGDSGEDGCLYVMGMHDAVNCDATCLGTVIDTLQSEGFTFLTFRQAISRKIGTPEWYRRNYVPNPKGAMGSTETRPQFWIESLSGNADVTYDEDGCMTFTDTDGGTNTVVFKLSNWPLFYKEYPLFDPNGYLGPAMPKGFRTTRLFGAVHISTDGDFAATSGARMKTGDSQCVTTYVSTANTDDLAHCEGVDPTDHSDLDGDTPATSGPNSWWMQTVGQTAGSATFCRPTVGLVRKVNDNEAASR